MGEGYKNYAGKYRFIMQPRTHQTNIYTHLKTNKKKIKTKTSTTYQENSIPDNVQNNTPDSSWIPNTNNLLMYKILCIMEQSK